MAGMCGFLHDQISYTVSPEYFTRLKFYQFNIPVSLHNRIGAGIVGIQATWWMGLLIGIIVIPIGLIIPTWKNYFFIMVRAFSYIGGIAGMVLGIIYIIANKLRIRGYIK
jgi:hypothetical protein